MGFKPRAKVSTEEAMSRAEEIGDGYEAYFWYLIAAALGEGEANTYIDMMEEVDRVAPEDVTLANFQVACWFARGAEVAVDDEIAREHLSAIFDGELDPDLAGAVEQVRVALGIPEAIDVERSLGPAMPYTPGHVGSVTGSLRAGRYKKRAAKPLAPTESIWSVAFSPSGDLILSGGIAGEVLAWDPATREPIARHKNTGAAVSAIDFSPDGRRIVASSEDSLWITLLDLETDSTAVLKGHEHAVAARFIDGGARLAAADFGGVIRIWDLETAEVVIECSHGALTRRSDPGIWTIAVSPDGELLAVADGDYGVGLYRIPSLELVGLLEGHIHLIHGLAFDATGARLLSASRDDTVICWDVERAAELKSYESHRDAVYRAEFHRDGIVSGGLDGRLVRTDLATGETVELARTAKLMSVAVCGDLAAAGGEDDKYGGVVLWADLG